MVVEKSTYLENLQVLYVEDNKETQREMGNLLKRHVGKFHMATDGVEGLEKFKLYRPEILIVDLLMPRMGGIEMIEHIRLIDEDCHIIVTSTVDQVSQVLTAVDLGIDKYIIKPLKVPELVEELNRIASKIWRKQNKNLPIEGERKRKIEDEIKRLFAAFLKMETGKGPRDINVFIRGNSVEIIAQDTLTTMEKSMMKKNTIDSGDHCAIIIQNRKYFYAIKEKQIEEMIFEAIGKRAEV